MDRVQRRLAAILAVDAVGYSRLMAANETETLTELKAHRRDVFDPEIARHGGRVVKLMGDGALVEFVSAVDAINCAVAIQLGMAERNKDIPEEKRIDFRVGVNVGDVMIDGDDIYGDGVNIAARIECLAQPGCICISGTAHDQVLGKVEFEFTDMGEQKVKNIDRPIRTYAIAPAGQPTQLDAATPEGHRRRAESKPAIAVMPLTNMSGDPEQEYFADGMTEDLITDLSRFQSLSVIARNSSFTYKGQAVKTQDVGRELGVDYVVEGSIRKAGNRVRVTVQLVEAATGTHIWAERFDRELTDLFDMQDELTRSIVATISGRLENVTAERVRAKPPTDLDAYDCVMRAKLCHHRGGREDNDEALQLLDKAIELSPGYASAYAWKVCVLSQAWTRGYRQLTDDEKALAMDLIGKGYSADENDLECVRILAEYYIELKQFDEAERFHRKAFMLNPNDPRIIAQRGELAIWRGNPEEGLVWVEKAIQVDPFGADDWSHLLGRAQFGARRCEEALRAFKKITAPRYVDYAFMAACYAELGRTREAGEMVAELLKLNRDVSVLDFVKGLFYENEADIQRLVDALKIALPSE
jgi:adenylate cyclase